jgi:hypothetical protein
LGILRWNAEKVKKLSGLEIWLFIIGRGLMALAVGIISTWYFPQIANPLAVPMLITGAVLFLIASKGLIRAKSNSN